MNENQEGHSRKLSWPILKHDFNIRLKELMKRRSTALGTAGLWSVFETDTSGVLQ
jgi:hypothetical protein